MLSLKTWDCREKERPWCYSWKDPVWPDWGIAEEYRFAKERGYAEWEVLMINAMGLVILMKPLLCYF